MKTSHHKLTTEGHWQYYGTLLRQYCDIYCDIIIEVGRPLPQSWYWNLFYRSSKLWHSSSNAY